jgi:hypothetical protein
VHTAQMSIASFWFVIAELFLVLAIYHFPVPAHWANRFWTAAIGGAVAWAKVGLVLWFAVGTTLAFSLEGGALAGETQQAIALFFLQHPSLALLVGPIIAVQIELSVDEIEESLSQDRSDGDDR